MDYSKYHLSFTEWGKAILMSVAITITIAFLFFNSKWALAIFPLVCGFVYQQTKNSGLQKQKSNLSIQFLDAMRVVSTALMAGLSIENAWKEAQKEVDTLYGRNSPMFLELQEMNHSVALNVPLEQVLEEFAERTDVEDIISFAEVFTFAKRSGGNFVKIIDNTTEHMKSKVETQKEIEVLIASKRLEQKVMNLVPIFILAYLRLSSDGYLDVLYGNWFGRVFMCICLAVYIVSFLVAERIMTIKI